MKFPIPFCAWTGRAALEVEIPDATDEHWRFRAAVEVAVGVGADLTDADLTRADLTRARLTGADLTRANLIRADLTDADLTRANLTGEQIARADLRTVEADLYHVLVSARDEAPGLLAALRAGKVDGSTYHGDCACLVGTIANIRGVDVDSLPRDSDRPIERWFTSIRRGDTPETNPVARIAERWIVKFLGRDPVVAE